MNYITFIYFITGSSCLYNLVILLIECLYALLKYICYLGVLTACQGKGKFGKLEREKSCNVVYGSARSSECEAHGPSATATI